MIKAEIKSIKQDENGNILVSTNYTRGDGTLVHAGGSRYNTAFNTVESIKIKIASDIKTHCKNLIARQYGKSINTSNETQLSTDMVGKKYQAISSEITVKDKIYTVNETEVLSVRDRTV